MVQRIAHRPHPVLQLLDPVLLVAAVVGRQHHLLGRAYPGVAAVEAGTVFLEELLLALLHRDPLAQHDHSVAPSAEVPGGGGIGKRLCVQGVESGRVAAEELEVFDAGSVGQEVDGAEPAAGDGLTALGQFVVEVGGREHGPKLVGPVSPGQTLFDCAFASGQFVACSGFHSKRLRACKTWTSTQAASDAESQAFRVIGSLPTRRNAEASRGFEDELTSSAKSPFT